MAKKIVTFGELLMRLSTSDNKRFCQSNEFCFTFGGAEANVAASLAQFGWNASFVSALPSNCLGTAGMRFLATQGVSTEYVQQTSNRLGIYFLEVGSSFRPSNVIYDRDNSAFSTVTEDSFDWDLIFDGKDWFHLSGVSAAVSGRAAKLCLTSVLMAKKKGLKVSIDLNYRATLWKYGVSPVQVMPDLVRNADVLVAGIEDSKEMLGVTPVHDETKTQKEECRAHADRVFSMFPNLSHIACTLRKSDGASRNTFGAFLATKQSIELSRQHNIFPIVDRIGTGDAFVAGLIYGLDRWDEIDKVVEYAAAAGCLKHAIQGDVNLISVTEVESLINGSDGGRIAR